MSGPSATIDFSSILNLSDFPSSSPLDSAFEFEVPAPADGSAVPSWSDYGFSNGWEDYNGLVGGASGLEYHDALPADYEDVNNTVGIYSLNEIAPLNPVTCSPSHLHQLSSPPASVVHPSPHATAQAAVVPVTSASPSTNPSLKRSYSASPSPTISLRALTPDSSSFTPSNSKETSEKDKPAGKGEKKKRKPLPTTAEFQHPDVSGLSKKEARLVKNRAAAFLSRQRKREQFDELAVKTMAMEGDMAALRDENKALKAALAAAKNNRQAENTPPPSQAATSPSPSNGSKELPTLSSEEVQSLQMELQNLRSIISASQAREHALQVELHSLRSQLSVNQTTPALSPLLSANLSGADVDEVMDLSTSIRGGSTGTREEKKRARSNRVGAVSLMIVLFSFAFWAMPSTTPNAPRQLRNLPPAGLNLKTVRESPAAMEMLRTLFNSTTSVTNSEIDSKREGICSLEDKMDSTSVCSDAGSPSVANSPAAVSDDMDLELPVKSQIEQWFPASPSDETRRSFSLTLLRPHPTPVPTSSSSAASTTSADEAIESVLQKWLGMSLMDSTSASLDENSYITPNSAGDGWVVFDPSTSGAGVTDGPNGVGRAWDGSEIEAMDLDQYIGSDSEITNEEKGLIPLPIYSSQSQKQQQKSRESSPAGSDKTSVGHPHWSPTPGHLTLPSSTSSAGAPENETFVRLDLELSVALKKREVTIVGKEEVGRLLGASVEIGSAWTI